MKDGSRIIKSNRNFGCISFLVRDYFFAVRNYFTSSLFFQCFPFLYPLTEALISEGSAIQEFQFYTAAKSKGLRKVF